jgi:hypothetical protein
MGVPMLKRHRGISLLNEVWGCGEYKWNQKKLSQVESQLGSMPAVNKKTKQMSRKTRDDLFY